MLPSQNLGRRHGDPPAQANREICSPFCIKIASIFASMSERQKTISLRRLAKLLLLAGATIYALICAVIGANQRSLIYHPQVFTSAQVEQKARDANLERWTNSAGQFIGFKRLSQKQPANGTVLVTYGNGSTATGSAHYADDIQKAAALDVFVLEYPGYEDRAGYPTEKNLFTAATEAFNSLPTNNPIYLVGESLGSGVASYLAGTFSNKISGVLLISPFDSLTSPAQYQYPYLPCSLLMIDRFPSKNYLRNYHGKIGVTVDGKDTIVPEKFGRRLYENYSGPKKLWEFPDGGHCQITGPQTNFWTDAIGFWQTNPK